jgi:F-type H+-transporting ATPase subunit a
MFRRTIFPTLLTSLLTTGASFAAEVSHEAHAAAEHAEEHAHALPLYAEKVKDLGLFPITNSMIMVWFVALLLIIFTKIATSKVSLIPAAAQNAAEWMIETLYDFLEGLLGAHLVKRCFWFLGSIFFFILFTNWMGLFPGVGTLGHYDAEGKIIPWLRGGNADLNMTSAMAVTFAVLWFYWALTENGIGGFLAHIFAPKGDFGAGMKAMLAPIFLIVGVLELVSIGVRPVALSFRLFGNIYGGEQTLEALMALIPKSLQLYLSWLPALPFYFMELLVGAVQALVFTLLCSIFIKLICDHGDEHHADGHH